MQRGQTTGDCEAFISQCLEAIREGRPDRLQPLLPQISVLRSPLFNDPLLELLQRGNPRQRELAAIALGTLGDPNSIAELREAFRLSKNRSGGQIDPLQVAIILALGEIGHGDAVEALLEIFNYRDESDLEAQRKQLVLASLGLLAQQGSLRAEKELTQLLNDRDLRVEALSELAVAYWHRPNSVPDSLILRMVRLADDNSAEVRDAAISALHSLARLGCREAEGYFAGEEG